MRRRDFLIVLGGAAAGWPPTVIAQTQSKVYRLGSISPAAPMPENSPFGAILLRELARRGYTLGQNLTYETRGAMGQINELPQIFQELMAKNVDVIVGSGYPVALVAKSSGVPTVVAFGVGDPVATGLIDGLARPGGNITGISDDAATLTTKRLGLLKEMAPNLRRVAMLWNNGDLGMKLRYEASARVANALGITVQPVGVREPKDFEAALAALNNEPPDALLVVNDALISVNRKRIFDYAGERRLPVIYEYDYMARAGIGERQVAALLGAVRPFLVAVERAGKRVDSQLTLSLLVVAADYARRRQAASSRRARPPGRPSRAAAPSVEAGK